MAVGKSSINRVAKSSNAKKAAVAKKPAVKATVAKKPAVKKAPAKKAASRQSVIAKPAIEVGVKQEFHGIGKELPTFLL